MGLFRFIQVKLIIIQEKYFLLSSVLIQFHLTFYQFFLLNSIHLYILRIFKMYAIHIHVHRILILKHSPGSEVFIRELLVMNLLETNIIPIDYHTGLAKSPSLIKKACISQKRDIYCQITSSIKWESFQVLSHIIVLCISVIGASTVVQNSRLPLIETPKRYREIDNGTREIVKGRRKIENREIDSLAWDMRTKHTQLQSNVRYNLSLTDLYLIFLNYVCIWISVYWTVGYLKLEPVVLFFKTHINHCESLIIIHYHVLSVAFLFLLQSHLGLIWNVYSFINQHWSLGWCSGMSVKIRL